MGGATERQPAGHHLPAAPVSGAASGTAIFTVSLPCPEANFFLISDSREPSGRQEGGHVCVTKRRHRKEHRDGRVLTKLGTFMLVYNYAIFSWHHGARVVVVMV